MGCLEMRKNMRSGVVWALAALCLGIAGATSDAGAVGIKLPIDIELGPQRTGDFGTLQITEITGGDLQFTICLRPVLGSNANLHEFYFNLSGDFDDDDDDDFDDDNLSLSGFRCNREACDAPFELDDDGPTRGGAGARFDFSVSFGDGSGNKGNGTLQVASFVLGGDEDLSLADVLAETSSTGRGLEVLFAAHVTGSGNGRGSASATIGVVPEPRTALLLGLGLAGLAVVGRRQRG